MNDQKELRVGYADRRRRGIHKTAKRVIWKARSRYIA